MRTEVPLAKKAEEVWDLPLFAIFCADGPRTEVQGRRASEQAGLKGGPTPFEQTLEKRAAEGAQRKLVTTTVGYLD